MTGPFFWGCVIYKLVKHLKTLLARLTTDQVKPGAGDGDGGDTGKSVTCIEGKTGPRGEKGDRGPAGPPGPSGDKGEPYVPYLMWGEATSCISTLATDTDPNMFQICLQNLHKLNSIYS